MNANTFGKAYCLTTFGESHGAAVGGVIDGCLAGLEVDKSFIMSELARRKPGQSTLTSTRNEADEVEFLSGLFEGRTTGAPIAFIIRNIDAKSSDYDNVKDLYRPSHADFTYQMKYGIRDYRGGGRASARTLAPCVVAGAIAKQVLEKQNIKIVSSVTKLGQKACHGGFSTNEVEEILSEYKMTNDTVGAVVHCEMQNVPVGLGEPVFNKFHAELAYAMMNINAAKGFEIGEGFHAAEMSGFECNDLFVKENGKIRTVTNHSGGVQGGITNGENVTFNVAFKPIPTIMQPQQTVDVQGNEVEYNIEGRHDVCVVPRVLPVVEAMAAMVTLDFIMLKNINRL
ncbi:MAG: chorismate synthase [Bacteroidales bacterium]|nr:chorismate synthase [Bacteroidales bacterium]